MSAAHDRHDGPTGARPYWNPYLAGVLLGLTLLATFVVAGQGLGATALPKRSLALGAQQVAPEWTAAHPTLGTYVEDGVNPLRNWIVVEVVGVFLGGFIGAVSAGRFRATVERGPRISVRGRLERGVDLGHRDRLGGPIRRRRLLWRHQLSRL